MLSADYDTLSWAASSPLRGKLGGISTSFSTLIPFCLRMEGKLFQVSGMSSFLKES